MRSILILFLILAISTVSAASGSLRRIRTQESTQACCPAGYGKFFGLCVQTSCLPGEQSFPPMYSGTNLPSCLPNGCGVDQHGHKRESCTYNGNQPGCMYCGGGKKGGCVCGLKAKYQVPNTSIHPNVPATC